jgi:probable F420-dependent oxidoreductase
MDLAEFGVWTTYRTIGEEHAGDVAKLAEALGFGALWLGGSPRLPAVAPLLAGSQRIAIATSIVNVWQYEPEQLAREHAQLTGEYPDRFLLGIGIGHPEATAEYSKPLTKMTEFLDGLDAASEPVAARERAIAALGPKMLDLSGSRSRGTLPYFVPVAHTRFARERLGDGPLVATELACVVDEDAERARATAREYASGYLRLTNYTANLKRFGFTDQDIAAGSDRLIDAVVPQGSAEQIAQVARAHLDAGADHVCLQPVGASGMPREQWTALAGALISG